MADVTISGLSPIAPATGLFVPASNGTTTGSVTMSQVCGVMTAAQITTALGYTPYNATNTSGFIAASHPGVAKAWVNFDGKRDSTGNASTANTNRFIRGSFNVSSVLRNSIGDYTVIFSNAFANANYCVQITSGNVNERTGVIYNTTSYDSQSSLTTASVRVMFIAATSASDYSDINSYHVTIFSN